MPIEYKLLAAMTILYLFSWLPSGAGKFQSFGAKWLASNREPIPGQDFLPWAGRIERAYANLKDNFPPFAITILLLGQLNKFDSTTYYLTLGFIIARVLHYITYGLGLTKGRFLTYAIALGCNLFLLIKVFL
jgi:uncharacterized MAPEG superfamily protein